MLKEMPHAWNQSLNICNNFFFCGLLASKNISKKHSYSKPREEKSIKFLNLFYKNIVNKIK